MIETVSFSSHSRQTSLTEIEVQNRLKDKVALVIQEISADNLKRKNHLENPGLLSEGIFYPSEYFDALKQQPTLQKRLETFKDKDLFFYGYTSLRYFKVAEDQGPLNKKVCSFILKEGTPSEALQTMKKGLSLIGCGEACHIAQYLAIEDVLGTEKFNALFAADGPTPLMIGSKLENNPIARLRHYILQSHPYASGIKKGDIVFHANSDKYLEKHYLGNSQGYNTICIDDTPDAEKYTALGLPKEGLTHEKINDLLIENYNRQIDYLERLSDTLKETYRKCVGEQTLKKGERLKKAQMILQEFYEHNGGTMTVICQLDVKKITDLANASIPQAQRLFSSYQAKSGDRPIIT